MSNKNQPDEKEDELEQISEAQFEQIVKKVLATSKEESDQHLSTLQAENAARREKSGRNRPAKPSKE